MSLGNSSSNAQHHTISCWSGRNCATTCHWQVIGPLSCCYRAPRCEASNHRPCWMIQKSIMAIMTIMAIMRSFEPLTSEIGSGRSVDSCRPMQTMDQNSFGAHLCFKVFKAAELTSTSFGWHSEIWACRRSGTNPWSHISVMALLCMAQNYGSPRLDGKSFVDPLVLHFWVIASFNIFQYASIQRLAPLMFSTGCRASGKRRMMFPETSSAIDHRPLVDGPLSMCRPLSLRAGSIMPWTASPLPLDSSRRLGALTSKCTEKKKKTTCDFGDHLSCCVKSFELWSR